VRNSPAYMSVIGVAIAMAMPAAAQKVGRVTDVIAPAEVATHPTPPSLSETSVVARRSTELRVADALVTHENGHLRVELKGGPTVSLAPNTRFLINKHDERAQQSAFELLYGSVRLKVRGLARPDSNFEIRTNYGVFGALGAADFVIDSNNPTTSIVMVYSGTVATACGGPVDAKHVIVEAGQSATTSECIAHPMPPKMVELFRQYFPPPFGVAYHPRIGTTSQHDTSMADGSPAPRLRLTQRNNRAPYDALSQIHLDLLSVGAFGGRNVE
jgi:hypothetical protein